MYSWEINDYITSRNNLLSRDDYLYITNMNINPQIVEIEYNAFSDSFHIITNDNYSWEIKIRS
jgi:hypothetical protein